MNCSMPALPENPPREPDMSTPAKAERPMTDAEIVEAYLTAR